jgi:predicted chitinase
MVAAMLGRISLDRAEGELAGFEHACELAALTTVSRRAMFLAMVGEESGSLRYTEELADGSEYNGRTDLVNTRPGDGPRFKGRSYIQITGRNNYGAFSRWAYAHHLVRTPTYFVDYPTLLADGQWRWIGPAWYWLGRHPHNGMDFLNEAADKADVTTATLMVNGGMNGYSDRLHRYQVCMALGDRLLSPKEDDEMVIVVGGPASNGKRGYPVLVIGGKCLALGSEAVLNKWVSAGAKKVTVSHDQWWPLRQAAVVVK